MSLLLLVVSLAASINDTASGNICRSPTAEAMFKSVVQKAGVADRYDIDSCGTGELQLREVGGMLGNSHSTHSLSIQFLEALSPYGADAGHQTYCGSSWELSACNIAQCSCCSYLVAGSNWSWHDIETKFDLLFESKLSKWLFHDCSGQAALPVFHDLVSAS